MVRAGILTPLLAFFLAVPCASQEWADKMFATRSHDFGRIARGAKAEFAFELTNLYVEDVHIAGVRVTCGCTTPRIERETLKTYEKGAIIARINSDRFLGDQRSTILVTIDEPYPAQVALEVKVHIVGDLLLEPSSVVLGSVTQGNAVKRTIRVRYTGGNDWQIVQIRSGNPHLTATATETARGDGETAYDLNVVLDPNAPVGYVTEPLCLITNDARTNEIPVPVEGRVVAALSVSPASLFLGVVRPGQSVTKQIVVRGQKPFRITAIRADCGCLKATPPKDHEPKSLYVVPITFTAVQAGKMTRTIHLEVDSGRAGLQVPTYAEVGP